MTQRTSRRTVLTATAGLAGAAAVERVSPPLPRKPARPAPGERHHPTRRANQGAAQPVDLSGSGRHRRRPLVSPAKAKPRARSTGLWTGAL